MEKVFLNDIDKMVEFAPDMKDDFRMYLTPFLFAVDGEVVLVGACKVWNNEMEMKYVTSLDRRKGYGRMLIEHLLYDLHYTEIWGEALPDAYHFWKKVGAVFNEDDETFFLDHVGKMEFEEDFLIPFYIHPVKKEAIGA